MNTRLQVAIVRVLLVGFGLALAFAAVFEWLSQLAQPASKIEADPGTLSFQLGGDLSAACSDCGNPTHYVGLSESRSFRGSYHESLSDWKGYTP